MFRQKISLLISAALIALLTGVLSVGTVAAQTATALPPTSPTPQRALLAFYNAVNRKDYNGAYAFWVNPGQTLQNFAAGYADTDHVEAYLGALQAGGATGAGGGLMPVVMGAFRNDGSVAYFWGCYQLQYNVNPATSWSIISADIRTLPSGGTPDTATLNAYLNINCAAPATWNVATSFAAPPDVQAANAAATLRGYYSLINRRDYATAYAQWLQPLPGPKPNGQPATDYRPAYTSFVSGYYDTVYANLYLGTYNATGASAGHSYLNGLMPAVLVGQHADGSIVSYYGCYVLGSFPSGKLGIVSGAFVQFSNDVPTGQQILQYLNVDCTSLRLQF